MLTLGALAVDRDGRIFPAPGSPAPALRFRWRGRPCEARLEPGRLRLSALAGRIPSTAEPGADRPWTVREVQAVPRALPGGLVLRVTPDHRLRLEGEAPAGGTVTALLGELVRFALALDPYLERLESAGAGTAKT
ncbi:hypothetical protein ACI6QG_16510 [Roseococcus sp. DSY-14]|uniref:hypothetical protein n=1 Tax=Roseococcus sp. DSY-14 TaxID=3369650 RepID=UPI00387A99C0